MMSSDSYFRLVCIFLVLAISLDSSAKPPSETAKLDSDYFSQNPHRERFFTKHTNEDYFALFDHSDLKKIELSVSSDEWTKMLKHFTKNIKSKDYFRANITLLTSTGKTTINDIGFRIRGNSTRRLPQEGGEFKIANFRFKFNETFSHKKSSSHYKKLKNRRYGTLSALSLKSSTIANDTPHMRERFAYDLFNQVGVKAPLTSTAHLTIKVDKKSVDYGIYTLVEPVDKIFLTKRYGKKANDGNLYKCLWQAGGPATLAPIDPSDPKVAGLEDNQGFRPTYDLKTNKKTPDHSALIDFTHQLDKLEGKKLKDYLDRHLEVDNLLKLLAMNVLIGMPDDIWGMANNYFLYFNNKGKIDIYPYDYDHSFGQGWRPFNTADADIYRWWNGVVVFSDIDDPRPILKIFSIKEYREKYLHYLRIFTEKPTGVFNYKSFEKNYKETKSYIDPDNDNTSFGEVSDMNTQISDFGIRLYFQNRLRRISCSEGMDQKQNCADTTPGFSVYFKAPDEWKNHIYIHYEKTAILDKLVWPGIEMRTLGEGWYGFEFPSGVSDAEFVFTDSERKTRSLNRKSIGCFVNNAWQDSCPGLTLSFVKPESWGNNVNIYYWNAAPALSVQWPGRATKKMPDGSYQYTITPGVFSANLIFNDGQGNKTGDLHRSGKGCYRESSKSWHDDCFD